MGKNKILQSFDPVSLSQMDSVKLLDRVDRKFVFSKSKLENFLEKLIDNYYVLEINNIRNCSYQTIYFDTDDFKFYTDHHNGKLNRSKVRMRRYVESDSNFFEIKKKSNNGRTKKHRITIEKFDNNWSKEKINLLNKYINIETNKINPKIMVNYKRITLVSKLFDERITIDTELWFENNTKQSYFNNFVIVELKQNYKTFSQALKVLVDERIHEKSLSKYCLGISSLYNEVKINNFKSKFNQIKKICYENI